MLRFKSDINKTGEGAIVFSDEKWRDPGRKSRTRMKMRYGKDVHENKVPDIFDHVNRAADASAREAGAAQKARGMKWKESASCALAI